MSATAIEIPAAVPARNLLDKRDVIKKTRMAESSIWRREHHGDFPKRIRIGGKCYWLEHEVDAWIDAQAATREMVEC